MTRLWHLVTVDCRLLALILSPALVFLLSAVCSLAAPVVSTTNLSEPPPLPPVWESPINYFRKLLAADSVTRDRMLAAKDDQQRLILIRSLEEYESLSPEVVETRLRALDLRAFLTPLLRMPLTNRTAWLSLVPDQLRPTIAARLKSWDALAPEIRQLILDNDSVMRLLLSSDQALPPSKPFPPTPSSPLLKQLETDISRWQQLPPDTRDRVYEQFRRLFDAPASHRSSLFSPLNKAELDQIEAAINKFHQLPKIERDRCLEGFQRFAELSASERRQFLSHAALWQRMSAEDRQLWRDLVQRIPPYPPGFRQSPHPPFPSFQKPLSVATTNR